jgi:O-antigen ligase
MERLVFGYGASTGSGQAPAADTRSGRGPGSGSHDDLTPAEPVESNKTDWAFIGLMTFTAVLYFRPQDIFTPLRALHLAELAALFALGSLAAGRLGRGLTITRMTPELAGVFIFGAVIVMTAPFAVWTGGALGTFSDMYAKVVMIFLLMVNTLTSPKRVEKFMWLIVIASGYIAGRAVFDYARGVNLIENGRVQGSVGGMFKNPNDLALNMVAVMPLAAMLALRRISLAGRALAVLAVVLMVGAVVASQSRSGSVGLAAMGLVLAVEVVRRKPAIVFAGVLAIGLSIPLLPESYFERLASITDEEKDQTGSREARSILLRESFAAFVENPLTGVGAGQFKNYDPEGRQEAWRESHNFILQVAAELGIFGLATILFLVGRAIYAPMQTRRLLRAMAPGGGRRGTRRGDGPPLSPADHEMISTHAAALSAALVGWFVCALFASVAYHWTFYYLLALAAAPRDYLLQRMATRKRPGRAVPAGSPTRVEVHA